MKRMTPEIITRADPADIFGKIKEFPKQLLKGWKIGGSGGSLPKVEFNNILFAGMGGSAIIGDLVYAILGDRIKIPFEVNRGYRVPHSAGPHTLFFASSYSGNTEETLFALEKALEKKCTVIGMTSGGKLHERAVREKFPCFNLPGGYPPRTATGFGLGAMLHIMTRLKIAEMEPGMLEEAAAWIEEISTVWTDVTHPDCLPLRIAEAIQGRLPIINASMERAAAVGFRWKTQLNENSKTHAFFFPIPEMSHNEIVGWERLEQTGGFFDHLILILLRLPDDMDRNQKRFMLTKKIVEESGGKVLEIEGKGRTYLSRLLYLIFLGDLASLYLAIAYGANPATVRNIDKLKEDLSRAD